MSENRAKHITLGPELMQACIGWDVKTWSSCFEFWEAAVPRTFDGLKVLELGANQGGLSLYFAIQGAQVLCSDLENPISKAQILHQTYGQTQIEYRALDAMRLDLPDDSFDIVSFKSILGGMRRGRDFDPRPIAIQEILRVLKPGGWLLFSENLAGSKLHMILRKRFIAWAAGWDYLTLNELPNLLGGFASWQHQTKGITALCGRTERQRQVLSQLDRIIEPLVKPEYHYCVCVAAQAAEA